MSPHVFWNECVCSISPSYNYSSHIGKAYELTGPRSAAIDEIAKEYERALARSVKYIDKPFEKWHGENLVPLALPTHVYQHVLTMAKLHAQNRYDRLTSDVEKITGTPSMSITQYVQSHQELFN